MNEQWLRNVQEVIALALKGYDIERMCAQDPTWRSKPKDQGFLVGYTYRAVKPHIEINGFDVPKPETDAPKMNQVYYIANTGADEWYSSYNWVNDPYDREMLSRGVLHLTEKDAITHAKALLGLPFDEGF